MKQALLFTAGALLLFCLGLVAGRQVFTPIERRLLQEAATAPENSNTALIADYKRQKLAFISFDLFNGLSRQDLEDLPGQRALAFYALVAALMAVILLRHGQPRKHGE
jgi:hypothetical protein